MLIVFGKLISIFAIVIIGYGASRIGWLPSDSCKYLSKLMIDIAAPCIVVSSLSKQVMNTETAMAMRDLFLLMFLLYAVSTVIGIIFVKALRIRLDEQGVYIFCLTYTNNGFLGFSVALAVFGDKGLFYMIIANLMLTFTVYTAGVVTILYGSGGKKDMRRTLKSMLSIPVIACPIGIALLIFGIPLPTVLSDLMDTLGNMMVPLSMLIIGIQLADSGIINTIKEKKLYLLSFMRLIVMPAATFFILTRFDLPPLIICTVVLSAALPPAALGVVFAEEYGGNLDIAAKGISMATFFSLFTIPLAASVLVPYFGL